MDTECAKLIEKANEYHRDVVASYELGITDSRYSDYFKPGSPWPYSSLIMSYLFRQGGGVDPGKMYSDLATKVKPKKQDLSFYDTLVQCKKGRDEEESNAFFNNLIRAGTLSYKDGGEVLRNVRRALALNVLEPSVFQEHGKLYLWCQKDCGSFRVDVVARYGGDVEKKIDELTSTIEAGKAAADSIEELDAFIEKKKAERKALGLFKGQRGKDLKSALADAKSKRDDQAYLVSKGAQADATLNEIYTALEAFNEPDGEEG